MFLTLTVRYGKPLCTLLYAVFGALAGAGIWIPLVVLAGMHLVEYFAVVFKLAKQRNISQLTAFCNCLAFGFTWWLPIKARNAK